jgi:hypothetical protein
MSDCRVHRTFPGLWVAAALVGLSGGCGSSGGAAANYESARLEGEVTLDGKPLEEGTIQFVPQDQKAPPVQATILKGRYVAPKVGLGKAIALLTVEPPARPAVVDSSYTPPPVTTIPERYKKGLPVEVKGDKSDQDFAMSSK